MQTTKECRLEDLNTRLRTLVGRFLEAGDEILYCSQTTELLPLLGHLHAHVITKRRYIHACHLGIDGDSANTIDLVNIRGIHVDHSRLNSHWLSVSSSVGAQTVHGLFASREASDEFCSKLQYAQNRASLPTPRTTATNKVEEIMRLIRLYKDEMLTETGLRSELNRILGEM